MQGNLGFSSKILAIFWEIFLVGLGSDARYVHSFVYQLILVCVDSKPEFYGKKHSWLFAQVPFYIDGQHIEKNGGAESNYMSI